MKLQITSSNFSKIQFNLVTFEILIVVSIKFRQTVLLDVLKMMSFKKLKKKIPKLHCFGTRNWQPSQQKDYIENEWIL